VAPKTGEILLAAGEPERDDVSVGTVVSTPSFVIDVDAADRLVRHGTYSSETSPANFAVTVTSVDGQTGTAVVSDSSTSGRSAFSRSRDTIACR
jgi:hypothetical protein